MHQAYCPIKVSSKSAAAHRVAANASPELTEPILCRSKQKLSERNATLASLYARYHKNSRPNRFNFFKWAPDLPMVLQTNSRRYMKLQSEDMYNGSSFYITFKASTKSIQQASKISLCSNSLHFLWILLFLLPKDAALNKTCSVHCAIQVHSLLVIYIITPIIRKDD